MVADLINNYDANGKPVLLNIDEIIKTREFQQSEYLRLLSNIQGNILKDHGRDHSLHFFLRGFSEAPDAVKQSIQNLAQATYRLSRDYYPEKYQDYPNEFHYVASAKEQYQLGRLSDIPVCEYGQTYFVNIALSQKGFETLGKLPPDDTSFRGSLKAAPKRFVEESPSQVGPEGGIPLAYWETKYDDLDAMLLVAHQDKNSLVDEHEQPMIRDENLHKLLEPFQRYVVAVEYGHVMYDRDDQNLNGRKIVEHFGFQDGISNPLFYTRDLKNREKVDIESHALDNTGYSQAAPLKLVLIPDPNCQPDDCAYGSYLVVAKLEQNVKRFHQDIIDLANLLEGSNDNEKINRAKALVIGRFPDGTPIALQEHDGGIVRSARDTTIAQYPNNFGYPPAYPPNPGPCPFQAHVRRANPRNTQVGQPGEGQKEEDIRGRRIVRRGITYGIRNPEPKDRPRLDQLPTKDVGILFMCFQASIVAQFEWIIVMWILYTSQRDAMVATKPLGDEPKKGDALICDKWPKKWDPQDKGPFPYGDIAVYRFQRHVTLKGGEYFFAPSIVFLRNITKVQANSLTTSTANAQVR